MRLICIIQLEKFWYKKGNPNLNSRAIKRSPFGRSLCSAGLFQSVVPPSVPQTTCHQKKEQPRKMAALFLLSAFPVFTRSLPAFVGATASATQTRRKNAGQCSRPPPPMFWRLLNRQPSTSIGTSRRKSGTDFLDLFRFASLFRLPFHAHSLPALKKGFPVCGGCSIAATPPPSHKKTKKNGFFCSFGVFRATRNKY